MDTFNQCFTENRYSEQINQDFQEGQALGVHSTPSILVDRQIVLSSVDPNYIPSYENIVNAIETALTNK